MLTVAASRCDAGRLSQLEARRWHLDDPLQLVRHVAGAVERKGLLSAKSQVIGIVPDARIVSATLSFAGCSIPTCTWLRLVSHSAHCEREICANASA